MPDQSVSELSQPILSIFEYSPVSIVHSDGMKRFGDRSKTVIMYATCGCSDPDGQHHGVASNRANAQCRKNADFDFELQLV